MSFLYVNLKCRQHDSDPYVSGGPCSDCHGGTEIVICKKSAVKDVVTNTPSPFMDFGCSDAFTKGDRNTEWTLYPLSRCTWDKADSSPGLNIKAADEVGRKWLTSGTLPTSLWNHCNLLKCFVWWASPIHEYPFPSIHYTKYPQCRFISLRVGKTSYLHNCTSWVIKVRLLEIFQKCFGKYLVWDCSWNAGPGPDTSWWAPPGETGFLFRTNGLKSLTRAYDEVPACQQETQGLSSYNEEETKLP